MAIMYFTGIELHTVSLAALIVVLGMVVDNAIVVIDSHIEKLDEGDSPWDAAWKSATELFVPVLTATLAIIAVFMPLDYFLTGMEGDFAFTFPITIAIALLTSFVVAVTFVPIINSKYIRHGLKKDPSAGPTFLDRMQQFYDWSFEKSFRKPKMSVVFAIAVLGLSIFLLSMVPRELFPLVERNQFAIEIYLPAGSSLDVTGDVVRRLEAILAKDKRITMMTSFVGTSSPRFHTTYAPNMPAKNYAQMIVATGTNEDTEDILDEYNKKYRDCFPEAYVRWKQLAMNPTQSPIEIRLKGNDIGDLKKAAAMVTAVMKKTDNTVWIRNDFEESVQLEPSSQGLRVDIRSDEANRLGFTGTFLSYSLAVGTKGLPLSTVWEGDYPVDIMLHVDRAKKSDYSDILNQYVTSPFLASTVQLRQIADIKPEWSCRQIVRRNGVRTITVKTDVERGIYASAVLAKMMPELKKLKLPAGVELETGGEYEREGEAYVPMACALMTGIAVIFFILLFQFRSIRTTLLVMSTVPLSFFGAALGLHIMRFPFGFTAFIGVMGLAGLVIRNGVILVDYADGLRSRCGLSAKQAALAAGKRRLRPIFLTSAAAAVGVIPMMISRSPLWGPLASVICFGLLFSMILTLYIVPVLYMYAKRSVKY